VISNFGIAYNHNNPNGILNANGTPFRPGIDPLPPNQLPGADVLPPNEVASPTLATPYSEQISLGYSWQVNPYLGINVEAVSIDYKDIPYRFRANPIDPATGVRRFPQFGNFRMWSGEGEASYEGVNLSFRARATDKLELQGFYTYSEAEGNILAGADEFRLTDRGHQPSFAIGADVSVNPLNPQCGACFGPLNTDARHKLTVSGLYNGPWGLLVAGMYRYRSDLPITLHSNRDLNGDGFRIDLAPGVSHVNSARTDSSFQQFDLRLSKEFTFGDRLSLELVAEMFNVFNEENPASFALIFDANGNPIGTQPTAFAGDPLQGEQRLTQLGVRVRF